MYVCVERGVEIDICANCNGVWLDAGELTKLAETKEGHRCLWTIPTNQESPLTTFHCSRCSDTLLVKVIFKHHAFHGCNVCNGLFIDSETLDSIISIGDENKEMANIAGGVLDAISALLFW